MSKYKPLADFLARHEDDAWTVPFTELEKILGFALPKAARERSAWWANEETDPKPHARAWLDHGFRTEALDIRNGEVTFRRHQPVGANAALTIDPPGVSGEPETVKDPDPTAHEVMAAAEALYERDRAASTAKKVGLVAAVAGVLGGAALVALRLVGKRK